MTTNKNKTKWLHFPFSQGDQLTWVWSLWRKQEPRRWGLVRAITPSWLSWDGHLPSLFVFLFNWHLNMGLRMQSSFCDNKHECPTLRTGSRKRSSKNRKLGSLNSRSSPELLFGFLICGKKKFFYSDNFARFFFFLLIPWTCEYKPEWYTTYPNPGQKKCLLTSWYKGTFFN